MRYTAKKKSEYDLQAEAFLTKHQLKFSILGKTPECPPYCNDPKHTHGARYLVEFSGDGKPRNKPLRFPFWNSYADEHGPRGLQFGPNFHQPKPPTPYSVLTCISSDSTCPDTFEDFCAEFGYEKDSRKAFDTFIRCSEFAQELRAFFTPKELADLQEIH